MKTILSIWIFLSISITANAVEQNTCEPCQCPDLRQHTWQTLKTAWHQGKQVSKEQWLAFLKWHEAQQQKQTQTGEIQSE